MKEKDFIKKYKDYIFVRHYPCAKSKIYNIKSLVATIKESCGECGDDIIYHFYKNGKSLTDRIKNMKFDYCFSESELIDMLKNKEEK